MSRLAIMGVVLLGFIGAAIVFAIPKFQERAAVARAENQVKEFSLAYVSYQKANGRPPRSIEELLPLVHAGAAELRANLVGKRLAVQWGALLDPQKPGANKRVLAYLTETVKGEMVIVLMQDGSLRQMTVTDVGSAEKATVEEATGANAP